MTSIIFYRKSFRIDIFFYFFFKLRPLLFHFFQLGDRVIVENSERMQYSFDQRCQCVVGQVSIHPLKACHIGTPNRLRWLGIRPRSGKEISGIFLAIPWVF